MGTVHASDLPELRAEPVGSLLRPPWLLEAREALARGELAAPAFKAVEDRAVDEAVALQQQAGLDVVTDGEMRRLSFQSPLADAVEGLSGAGLNAYLWGRWSGEAPHDTVERERPADVGVVSRLRRRRSLCAEELVYLRARAALPAKVTLASPSLWANFWPVEAPPPDYPTLDAFLADVADILREEAAELARLGCRYIQLDAPHYTALLDPEARAFYEARSGSAERWLARGAELDNAVMAAAPGVTFGVHLCRGNQESRWLVSGDYEPLARELFPRLQAGRLLLEYDDARAGGFEPLRWVREDQVAVLGLVSTKTPRLEDPEALRAQVQAAARHCPPERLALSPQCGFASSVRGNRLSPEDQGRKLRLVAETARAVLG